MAARKSATTSVRRIIFRTLGIAALAAAGLVGIPRLDISGAEPGMVVDSLDGVYVYNNGPVAAVYGRNLSETGYNIGLKYQCVEFVKRYYLYRYAHEMPDSYGHARDFFDPSLADGGFNTARGLLQFRNGSASLPRPGDMVIFKPTIYNRYGHVAIVSSVGHGEVEVIQQNRGRVRHTRESFPMTSRDGVHRIGNKRIAGWLRIKDNQTEI